MKFLKKLNKWFLIFSRNSLLSWLEKNFGAQIEQKSSFDHEKQGWVTVVGNLFHLLAK